MSEKIKLPDIDDEKAARKLSWRERNVAKLDAQGVDYRTHNGGAHLKICDPVAGIELDFRPSTGKWYHREAARRGVGIESLSQYLRQKRNEELKRSKK